MKKVLKNISYTQLAVEFISVVFAVLLALGFNSYKQSLDTASEAKVLKEAILRECESNLAKIDSILIKNQEYRNFLDSIVRMEENEFQFYFSYEFEMLTKGAWEIAQNHNAINNLDPKFILSLSNLYNSQNFYLDHSSFVFKSVGEQLAHKKSMAEKILRWPCIITCLS
ncbi:MAG: hypothetical protein ACJA08_001660 [Cyclobacteriaceae bacterium]|jgi:uncharacterized protein with von Willebrand factor type A (vWA) domain